MFAHNLKELEVIRTKQIKLLEQPNPQNNTKRIA